MSSNFRSASKGLCRDNFSGPGQFGNLHGIFVGSDGSVYVASIVALAFVSIVSIVSIAWLLGHFAQVSQLSSEAESWLRVHSILADITTNIVSPEDSAGNWKPSIGTVLARSEDLGGAYTHAEAFETREGRASVTRISALSEIEADINGFRTSVVAALATDLSAKQQEYGKTIQSSAEALLKVIDDVLDFSKVEAGKLELESVDFDLRPIVSSVLALISPVAWNKGVCVFSLLRCR